MVNNTPTVKLYTELPWLSILLSYKYYNKLGSILNIEPFKIIVLGHPYIFKMKFNISIYLTKQICIINT